MKRKVYCLIVLLVLFLLPSGVLAANSYRVYTPVDNYVAGVDYAIIEEAVAAATGACINDLTQTTAALCAASEVEGATWAPGMIVISGDDLTITSLTTDAVLIVNNCDVTVAGPVSVFGAGTFGDAYIVVGGEGKATVASAKYPSYVGNASTFAFDISEEGSAVLMLTVDGDTARYDERDEKSIETLIADLIGLGNPVYTGYEISGKVTLRQNLGILGGDGLVVINGGELVVPNNINLDNRSLLAIEERSKLTLGENATLYNTGIMFVEGNFDANGTILNGYRSTNGEDVNVGEGIIVVEGTGTLDINKTLTNANETSVNNEGTINVARGATVNNPQSIQLEEEGILVNNTPEDITIMRSNVGSEPTEQIIPGVPANPQTNDSIIIAFALGIISLTGILVTTIYTRKRYN